MKRLLFIGVYLFFAFALFAQKTEISTSQIVDLGLSVKWAGWNVGASTPEEYGGLYGWADPNGKKVSGNNDEYPNENPPINISGTEYDIAHIQWGHDWRLPTKEEMEELINKCKWKWFSYHKTNGYKVTGPNGQSIFLPAAGYRSGWLGGKVLEKGIVYDKSVIGQYMIGISYDKYHTVPYLYFHSGRRGCATGSRSTGYSVRPVMGTSNSFEKPIQDILLKTVQLICKDHSISTVGEDNLQNSYKEHKIVFELFKSGLSIKIYDGAEYKKYKIPKETKVRFKYIEMKNGGGMVEKLWVVPLNKGIGLEYNLYDVNKEYLTIWTQKGSETIKTVHHVDDAYFPFLDLFLGDETIFEPIRADK